MTKEFSNEGCFLSGGEMQRLALARIYVKKCSLIILDEPSSALDPWVEYEMIEKMRELTRECCTIFISHRLRCIRHVDRIYMLEGGKILECGSHDELIARNGKYAEMYQKQNIEDVIIEKGT